MSKETELFAEKFDAWLMKNYGWEYSKQDWDKMVAFIAGYKMATAENSSTIVHSIGYQQPPLCGAYLDTKDDQVTCPKCREVMKLQGRIT